VTLRLGIDIGGSKIAVAGERNAERLFDACFALEENGSGLNALAALQRYLDLQCRRHGLSDHPVIASAPNIDSQGRISRWPNRRSWEGVSITHALARFAGCHLFWCDDGTAATVADAWSLRATDLAHFSLGAGVGGGIRFEGRVLRDRELGHLLVHPGGLACICGRRGCLQPYASGRALVALRREFGVEEGLQRWVVSASEALAACSANLIRLFGITHITLSGAAAFQCMTLPAAIATVLRSKWLDDADPLPTIKLSPNGSNASLQGALALSGAGEEALKAVCRPLPPAADLM
jgi:predicted NBD/HSP70 family sugar kinase